MSKISTLPFVAAPAGDETVVILKDGVAKRARIDDLGNASALTAQKWAEGVEPGGAGTRSAKGWAQDENVVAVAGAIDDITTLAAQSPAIAAIAGDLPEILGAPAAAAEQADRAEMAAASVTFSYRIAPESGYRFVFTVADPDNLGRRIVYGLGLDGIHRFYGGVELPAGSVRLTDLNADLRRRVFSDLFTRESGYRFGLTVPDADGLGSRLALHFDGHHWHGPFKGDTARALAVDPLAVGATIDVEVVIASNGSQQLKRIDRATGVATMITSPATVGNAASPRMAGDDVFFVDTTKRAPHSGRMWVAHGGTPKAATPGKRMVFIGHSLNQGPIGIQPNPVNPRAGVIGSLPAEMQALLGTGWDIVNRGNFGATAVGIAALNGAEPVLIRVTGGSIPAAAPVTLTRITPDADLASPLPANLAGPLAPGLNPYLMPLRGTVLGQPCVLTFAANVYSIAQVGGTAPLAVPNDTPFIVDMGDLDDRIFVIWNLRNRPLGAAVGVFETALIGSIKTHSRQFILITDPYWPTAGASYEGLSAPDQTARNAMKAHNDWKLANHPDSTFDLNAWLWDLGPTGAFAMTGIVRTAADDAAIADQVTPPSLTYDGQIHFNAPTNRALALRLRDTHMIPKGMLL
ncbi:hypothetical protein [Sphingomonas sp.]|uniref:hypothetical protein n=1 Tax=Sphingomonas sp. TaxID=28214 RepID=UPI00307F43AA